MNWKSSAKFGLLTALVAVSVGLYSIALSCPRWKCKLVSSTCSDDWPYGYICVDTHYDDDCCINDGFYFQSTPYCRWWKYTGCGEPSPTGDEGTCTDTNEAHWQAESYYDCVYTNDPNDTCVRDRWNTCAIKYACTAIVLEGENLCGYYEEDREYAWGC